MTDRERNQLACRLALPLWEHGYCVLWTHDTKREWTHFCLIHGEWAGGILISDANVSRIRSLDFARLIVLQMAEETRLAGSFGEISPPGAG